METKGLDVVYFVKDGLRNDELRYSIRSVFSNLEYNMIWIYGGCLRDIVPDVRVRVEQEGRTKWDRVRNMYQMVCKNKEITDNFIMFHDDFFVMQPTKRIDPIHRCSLEDHIKILEPHKPTEYSKLLRRCRQVFPDKDPLSYEVHTPFIFNKEHLLEILGSFPDLHCIRSIYGNIYYGDISKRSNDVKIFDDSPSFDYKSSQFLSTDDSLVNVNNDIWRWIRKQFPTKSKYEL